MKTYTIEDDLVRDGAVLASVTMGADMLKSDPGGFAHWLRLQGVVNELYDVISLPGVVRPMMIGFRNEKIRRTVSIQ